MYNYNAIVVLCFAMFGCSSQIDTTITNGVIEMQECGTQLTECSCKELEEDNYVGRVVDSDRCDSGLETVTSCSGICPQEVRWARICFCE